MKKKVLFMVINMNVGGTEKALLNMISEMPKEKYELTILMLEEYGGFLKSIPSWVKIKYVEEYHLIKEKLNKPPKSIMKNAFLNRKVLWALFFLILTIISKITKEKSIIYKYLLKSHQNDPENYDVAVAYAGPMDFISFFILKKIKATKKYQWIHFDVTKIGFNKNFANKFYKEFDKIFLVSNEAKEKFIRLLPNFVDKVDVFQNCISTSQIVELANKTKGFTDDFKGMRIVTVGRLSREKGQNLTIPVLSKLLNEGYNVRWYCVGEGSARKEYELLIKHYGLEDSYILMGEANNPFPYIKECDIYVQSSIYEGYCITLNEAKCLEKPIITTAFTGAMEQIRNGENGLIVPVNGEAIFDAVKRLLDNQNLSKRFSSSLAIGKNDTLTTTVKKLKMYY